MSDRRRGPATREAGRWIIQPWPLACLLIGMAAAADMQLVGRILGTEILAILLIFGMAFFSRLPIPDRLTGMLMGLAGVWLVAQYASDLVNNSTLDNTLRGLARAGMTIVLVYAFYVLLAHRMQRTHMLFLGLAGGFLLIPLISTEEAITENVWKFGYGVPVTMLCAALASWFWRRRRRMLSLAPTFAIALVNVFLGFRSMAGITLAVVLVQLLLVILGTRHVLTTRHAVSLALAVSIGIGGIIPLYSAAAEKGWLGRQQQERYLDQVNDYGILLSGRIEWRIAPLAFLEKPLLGHGSWGEDERYAAMAWELFSGSSDNMPVEFSNVIPTHSHLLGALVEGGVFSGLFWLLVLALLVRSFLVLIRYPVLADPIIVFILISLSWAVLFSPYGLSNRVFACFAIAAMVCMLHQARQLETRMAASAKAAS